MSFRSLSLRSMAALVVMATLCGCNTQGNVLSTSVYSVLNQITTYFTVQDGTGPTGYSLANGVTVDSSNNVYVTGYTFTALDGQSLVGTGRNYFITKYTTSGVRQWTILDGAPAGNTYVDQGGITTDAAGNIYITGYTDHAIDGQTFLSSTDFFITKYNSSGVRQWTIEDGSSLGGYSYASGISLDSSGNIFVAGYTNKAIDGQTQHGNEDLFITKYNSSAVRQWTIQDGVSSGNTFGLDVRVDSSSNAYVIGRTIGAIDGQTQHGSWDLFITKYNASGVRQWTVQDGAASGFTYGNHMALDSSGNVYTTGSTSVAIDGQTKHGSSSDMYITKYNSSGTRQWTVEDGSSANTAGTGIGVDSSGNVYVSGYTSAALDGQIELGTEDFFVTKYNSTGLRQWTKQDGAAGATAASTQLALDSSGNSYVVGSTNVAIDGQTQHGTSDIFITQYGPSGSH